MGSSADDGPGPARAQDPIYGFPPGRLRFSAGPPRATSLPWRRRPGGRRYRELLGQGHAPESAASDAEVDVVLDITAKVPHVFQSFTGLLNEAGEALDRAALFLRQHVRG